MKKQKISHEQELREILANYSENEINFFKKIIEEFNLYQSELVEPDSYTMVVEDENNG